MTSTPNSSFDHLENGRTAHNIIGKRKSKRTPAPLIVSLFLYVYIYKY